MHYLYTFSQSCLFANIVAVLLVSFQCHATTLSPPLPPPAISIDWPASRFANFSFWHILWCWHVIDLYWNVIFCQPILSRSVNADSPWCLKFCLLSAGRALLENRYPTTTLVVSLPPPPAKPYTTFWVTVISSMVIIFYPPLPGAWRVCAKFFLTPQESFSNISNMLHQLFRRGGGKGEGSRYVPVSTKAD